MHNRSNVERKTDHLPGSTPFRRLRAALQAGKLKSGKAIRRILAPERESGLTWKEMADLGERISDRPTNRRPGA
jgi:hypothetical protein